MSASAGPVLTSALLQGPRWSARASDWAELAAGISMPAWEAVADAVAVGPGTRVLDVGCGSGVFCRLAAARGAAASGIDAAEGMISVARRHVPGADLRVGAMERLPWDDAMFDVVTGFNALQFAADVLAALAEARRVARPGGRIAICNWSQPDDSDLFTVLAPLPALQPPREPSPPPPAPPAIGKPGVLERLARQAASSRYRARKSTYRSRHQISERSNAACSPAAAQRSRSNTPAKTRSAQRSSKPPHRFSIPTAPTDSRTASGTSSLTHRQAPSPERHAPHHATTYGGCRGHRESSLTPGVERVSAAYRHSRRLCR